MAADLSAAVAEDTWSLKLQSVKPGSSPVLDSLALAESLKSMNLRLIGDIQSELLKELGRKQPRASKLDVLLKGADIVHKTERILEKACGTHLKIAIETERRLQARAAGLSSPALGS